MSGRGGSTLFKWLAGLYVAVLYLSLSTTPDMVRFLYGVIGVDHFANLVAVLLLSILLAVVALLLRRGMTLGRMAVVFSPLLLVAAGLLAVMQSPAERLHFIEYGALGVLLERAFQPVSLRGMLWAVGGVGLVGALDEGIQWVLPNRYFDWFDIAYNLVGGSLGLLAALLYGGRIGGAHGR